MTKIPHKKALGQHYLIDQHAISKIVETAELTPNDTVLEIGPGPGALTTHLAAQAKKVIAVELDAEMIPHLKQTVQGQDNVEIVHGDILKQDIGALIEDREYKCVANLPYYITSAILRFVLESLPRPQVIVVTIQREVAQRIVAKPGNLSLLAVSVQFYGKPRRIMNIAPGAFSPPPKVHSSVLRIDCFQEPPWHPLNVDTFFQIVRAGFAHRRKQLHNALTTALRIPQIQIKNILGQAGIDETRRAQTLSIEEWVKLSDLIEKAD